MKLPVKEAYRQIAEHLGEMAKISQKAEKKEFVDFLEGDKKDRVAITINGNAIETYWALSLISDIKKRYSNIYVICPIQFHSIFLGQGLKMIPYFPASENHLEMTKYFQEHFLPQALSKINSFQ